MSKLLFKLHNVPEEEAQAIRDLLDSHSISWYETSQGNWGVSYAAIWLHNNDDFKQARALIDDYQATLAKIDTGNIHFFRDLLSSLRQRPLQTIVFIIMILVILLFFTKPFVDLLVD